MKKRVLWAVLVMGILVVTLWGNPLMAASTGPVELRAITAWPMHIGQNYWFHEFIKEVNERAKKAGIPLTIKKLGGPEVIGTMQQFAGMRSGAVDMVYSAGDYFSGETVELGGVGSIKPEPLYWLQAMRDTKVMDVVRAACREKSGVIPLFPVLVGRGFTLLSTKPINPGNWSGLKIRSIGRQTAIGITAMGGSAVLIPPAEVFDGLQRGTVDGVMGAASDRYSFGERGVYKYILMTRVFDSIGYWFIGAKVWDGLPENMKTFLESVSNDMEKAGLTWCSKWEYDTIIKYMDEDKVKLVWASPAEEDKLIKAFRTDNLDDMAKKSPKYGQKIRDLLKDY